MNEILTTINHTTVEALGFKYILASDTFVLNKIKVVFYESGNFSVSFKDVPVPVTSLDNLISNVKIWKDI